MKKKAFLSIFVCICMVVAMFSGAAVAANAEELMPTGITAGDGSYSNPYVVEDLPYTHEGKAGDDLYFTWTAPADGALYLRFTEGSCSMYSIDGSSVGSEQELENGYRIYVVAGDEISFNAYSSSWSGTDFKLEMTFVEGEEVQPDGSSDYPYPVEVPATKELAASQSVYYTWTAPEDGALSVMFTAADYYGSVTGASADKGSTQEVDGGYLQYVAAGDKVKIYVVNYDETPCNVSMTFEAGAQPGADGSEDFPYPIEEFPVTANGEEGQYIYYTWTATEDGAIYIMSSNADMTATVTGASADKGSTQEVAGGYRQYVAAGDEIRIQLRCWYGAYTAELTFVAGEQPEADGSSDFPLPVEVPSTHDQAANTDLYYTWTAVEDGVLTVTCTAEGAYVYFTVGGSWADATQEGNVYSLPVAAGDVIVVNVSESEWNDDESDFTVSFAFSTEGGQPDPGPGPGPGPDVPDLPEGVTGSGTATDPYIFTQAATLTLVGGEEDIYFQAPEGMQVAYTGGFVADAFWTEMDNPFIAGYNQTYVMTPDYDGVTVTITVSEAGGEPGPGPGTEPDPDPEGSEGNPIVIGQLPYSFNQTESDVYYTWTATEDGTLELTYSDSAWISFYVNDSYGYEEETETGCTLEVAAGDVVVINIYSLSEVFTGVLTFTAEGEVLPEEEMSLVVDVPDGPFDPSQTITVEVAVLDNPGFTSFKIRLDYDAEVLELVSLEAGQLCTGTLVANLDKGIATYAHGAAGAVTEDGVLLIVTFRVKDDAALGSTVVGAAADYFFGTENDRMEAVGSEAALEIRDHDYSITQQVEATCTTGGYTEHICSQCGHSYKENETPALGHDYESVVTEPTETEGGYTTHTCRTCGHSFVDSYTDPLEPNPETGDRISFVVVAMMLVSVTGVAVVLLEKKKRA